MTARLSLVSDPMTPPTSAGLGKRSRRRGAHRKPPAITDGRVLAALTATWALLVGAFQLL